jgi:hypothetical protein
MSESKSFPSDTCVLACSGPSLNLVDVFSLGLPVVAVSTAIRVLKNPHYWILADNLNEMHGDEGNIAYQNENIVKILPKGKIIGSNGDFIRNYQEFDYVEADRYIPDLNSHVFSGKLPFVKGPHKSVTFAIQYLHHVGVKNVIWVGNNLQANSATEKYAYESNSMDLRKAYNYNVTLDQVHKQLREWYPLIKAKGFEWYSWKCGDVFEQFVPKFDESTYIKPTDSPFFLGTDASEHQLNLIPTKRAIPYKVSKEERHKLDEFRKENVTKRKKVEVIQVEEKQEIIKPPAQLLIPKINKPPEPRYSKIKSGDVGTLNQRIRDSLR